LMVEGQDEITYLDSASLHVVTHPEGTAVFSSTTLYYPQLKQADPQNYLAFSVDSFVYPLRATWMDREEITDVISEKTDVPVAFDLAEDNWYYLDFGEVDSDSVHLMIDGWKAKVPRPGYPETLAQSRPKIKVQNEAGEWKLVKKLSWPRGDRKTVVFDVSDIPLTNGRLQIRFYTGTSRDMMATWFVDNISINLSRPTTCGHTIVHPRTADLSYFGLPEHLAKPEDTHLPLLNIPNGKGVAKVITYTSGNFTKYGDVTSLLKETNDHFCVMQKGDGITFTFPLDEPVDGQSRAFFLHSDLVYKQQKCPGVNKVLDFLLTVEPLPFKGLEVYPPTGPYELSPEADKYNEEWNTRVYVPYQIHESFVPL